MITAVDTSVLLDLFLRDERHGRSSRAWLVEAYDAGAIIVSHVVYAELAPAFPNREALDRALRAVNVVVSPIDADMAHEAGRRWGRYRQSGGARDRIITDFLIGAHAVAAADRFLTRDRGFFASYFPELERDD
ncbi:MAG: type II toxin-antitoxin system VapC family toxin [Gemmatimonadales bacterium]|nr:type II toxin-antitoxin system VapC family toxin [Gemmatimonadales bacterium]MYG49277.1 type II toxin-antitoxin system VapC family toxin [Gemmatimonadales bacterium]MYK03093.1 type II toxin-antitoxin system VapC family toxin [Candidatus Palauibacter ramosifaciens]